MTHTVRTTMRPDQELEVNDAEYLDLQRQGLLHGDNSRSETPTPSRDQTAATNPATPEQAQASAPATTRPAKPATTKEG
ncbi:hypothetical protein [Streptomyces sp. SID4982]|uniref:hypothetical protein n=1 Tax=Streptomyces sp. SID4982 TaxID=2690291 RepID=UPI00136CE2ED|nr:hypothetical protein [Streptomyces sp. SID4982]MYS15168.1 hypothetical protein [Streptomyces sp. SID4982]